MNKLEKYKEYRNNLNLIQSSNRCGSHVGCVRIFPNNKLEHERTKFLVCYILSKEGYDYITEAVFLDGKRADVFDIQRLLAIEILCSESDEKCDTKVYPVKIIKIKSDMSYEEIKRRIL